MNQPLAILSVAGGYRPSQSYGGPDTSPNTLFRGKNYWIRPGGRLVPVKGSVARAVPTGMTPTPTTLGPRIFPFGQHRAVIAGDSLSEYSSLVRYNQAMFFVSRQTGKQVYINESTSTTTTPPGPYNLTGVTTSTMPGKLRVAILDGSTYTAFDAGLQAPPNIAGSVAAVAGGSKAMNGIITVVACAKRLLTQTVSNPSPAVQVSLTVSGDNRIQINLQHASLALQAGQDAWVFAATDWGRGYFGPWREAREVRRVAEGTVSISSNDPSLTGIGTRFQRDLAVGDEVVIDGQVYIISTITSDTAATLVSTPLVTATGQVMTMRKIILDYRNGELGSPVEFNNDPPPILDGLMLFNNVPFGWKNNTLYPSKIGNPEAYPAELARSTQSGANIIQAIAGDAKIYLLTTNSLEVVTFTQNEFEPFLIRQAWSFGFSTPYQAVIAEGTLYAAVGSAQGVKIVRTRIDDSPDLEFSAAVESDMASWLPENVILGLDPANGAVLVMHYNGSKTMIIPFMLQQGVWGLPQEFDYKVVSAASVSNSCEMVAQIGANFLPYVYEQGSGTSTEAYAAWPFLDKDGLRQVIKAVKFTGKANTLRFYTASPGVAIPDVTNSAAASVSLSLSNTLEHESVIYTNIPNAQSFSVRVDSSGNSAVLTEITVTGLINRIQR